MGGYGFLKPLVIRSGVQGGWGKGFPELEHQAPISETCGAGTDPNPKLLENPAARPDRLGEISISLVLMGQFRGSATLLEMLVSRTEHALR